MRTATVYNFLVEANLIGSLMILAAFVFRALFRKKLSARLLLVLWLLVALRLLVPLALPNPLMNWLKPTLSQDAGIRPMADQVRVRMGDAAHALYYKTFGSGDEASLLRSLLSRLVYAARNGRFARLGFTVYLCGAGLSFLWMLGQGALFAWHIRRRRTGTLGAEYMPLLEEICKRHGLGRVPAVWLAEDVPGSTSFDLVRPVIVLPAAARAEDISSLLTREVCHIRRGDRFWALLRNLCCIVHWFNPLVWLAARASRLDMALAADETALRPLDEAGRRRYANALIHTPDTRHAQPALVTAATPMTLRHRQMTLRIRQALHPHPVSRPGRAAYLAFCLVVLLGMFATDEQSSLANLPTLTTPALRQEAVSLDTAEEAEAYARAFLELEGIDGAAGFASPTLTKTESGWQAQWYLPGAESPSGLAFTASGALLGYMSGDLLPENLQPLPTPIFTHTAEGQQWCTFLSSFIETHLPELWLEYEAMDVVNSGRLDGAQYITISLLGSQGHADWQAILMIAPEGRIISLLPVVG